MSLTISPNPKSPNLFKVSTLAATQSPSPIQATLSCRRQPPCKPAGRKLFDIGGRNITLQATENPAKVSVKPQDPKAPGQAEMPVSYDMTEVFPNKNIFKREPQKGALLFFSTTLFSITENNKFGIPMETTTTEYTVHLTEVAGQFIHEYPNGRRILVEVNPVTGKETFIREM